MYSFWGGEWNETVWKCAAIFSDIEQLLGQTRLFVWFLNACFSKT
jgi:hypothetical protein